MRLTNLILFIIILVLTMYIVDEREKGTNLQEITESMETVYNSTINISETYKYTNPYNESINTTTIVNNILNIVLTSGMKSMNLMLGTTTIFIYKYFTLELINACIYIIFLATIIGLFAFLIKPWAIIYVLLEEKRKERNEQKGSMKSFIISTTIIIFLAMITTIIIIKWCTI